MGRALFATVLLAGIIYGRNDAASMDDRPLATRESSSVQVDTMESPAASNAIEKTPREALEIAAVDYCYAGSLIDPTTGESVDLFVLCEEDGLEQNMDLA
jgi:hypothetical protein